MAELLKAEPQAAFYACDVRGIGESQPNTCGTEQFLEPYGSDFFYAIHAIMLDHPYLGPEDPRRAPRARLAARLRPSRGPPGGQGLGRAAGDVRRPALDAGRRK